MASGAGADPTSYEDTVHYRSRFAGGAVAARNLNMRPVNLASSGATVEDVYDQNKLLHQLMLNLDRRPSALVLSMGANSICLPDLVQYGLLRKSDKDLRDNLNWWFSPNPSFYGMEPFKFAVKSVLEELTRTMEPKSTGWPDDFHIPIVVLGYPFCTLPRGGQYGVPGPTVDLLRAATAKMNRLLQKAVDEVNLERFDNSPRVIKWLPTDKVFQGRFEQLLTLPHWYRDSVSTMWAIATENPHGPPAGQFHPNETGQRVIGELITEKLRPYCRQEASHEATMTPSHVTSVNNRGRHTTQHQDAHLDRLGSAAQRSSTPSPAPILGG